MPTCVRAANRAPPHGRTSQRGWPTRASLNWAAAPYLSTHLTQPDWSAHSNLSPWPINARVLGLIPRRGVFLPFFGIVRADRWGPPVNLCKIK